LAFTFNFLDASFSSSTVSKGSGLHLLLGRDEVLRTLAVGFLQGKKTVLINRFVVSTNKHSFL